MATITKLTQIAYSEGLTHKDVREAINKNSTTADTNFGNLDFAVTEAQNSADAAQITAASAGTQAANAQRSADEAKSAASTAQTAASTAVETANEAKTTATEAKTTATQASNTAKLAGDNATEAKTNAASAVTTANEAKTTATTAKTTADTAKTTADAAKTAAATAQTTANNALAQAQMLGGMGMMVQFDSMPLGKKTMDSNVDYTTGTLPTTGVTIEFYQSADLGGSVRERGVFVAKTASRYYVNWKAEPAQGIPDSRLLNNGATTSGGADTMNYLTDASWKLTNGMQAGSIFICRATGRMIIKDATSSDGWKYLDSTHWPE